MRGVANVVLSGDGHMLARKRQQLRVLRRGGHVDVDGEEDGAVVTKDDEGRAVLRACLGTSRANGFVESLGVRACRIDNPTGDGDIGSAICSESEAGKSCEGSNQKLVGWSRHFVTSRTMSQQTLNFCSVACANVQAAAPCVETLVGPRPRQLLRQKMHEYPRRAAKERTQRFR